MDSLTSLVQVVFGLVLLGVFLMIGLLPALVAGSRHHHNVQAIRVLNVFVGLIGLFFPVLFVLGWCGALVWACTAVSPPARD